MKWKNRLCLTWVLYLIYLAYLHYHTHEVIHENNKYNERFERKLCSLYTEASTVYYGGSIYVVNTCFLHYEEGPDLQVDQCDYAWVHVNEPVDCYFDTTIRRLGYPKASTGYMIYMLCMNSLISLVIPISVTLYILNQ